MKTGIGAGVGAGAGPVAWLGGRTSPRRIHQVEIRDLTGDEARRPVLVATDCLSEGVNLQEHFQAVVHYDLTPSALGAGSQYRQVLTSHGFSRQHELRPDVTLTWTDPQHLQRWLLVECKLSQKLGVGHAARQALADLLAYRRSFDNVLSKAGEPYGLGVAWGAGLSPVGSSEIALCTPDTISEAVAQIVT